MIIQTSKTKSNIQSTYKQFMITITNKTTMKRRVTNMMSIK